MNKTNQKYLLITSIFLCICISFIVFIALKKHNVFKTDSNALEHNEIRKNTSVLDISKKADGKPSFPEHYNQSIFLKTMKTNYSTFKWLSEDEVKNVDFNEKKNKWYLIRNESLIETKISTREQAIAHLNKSASFARFPSVGSEDAEYFYFSLLADRNMPDDFSSGFSVKKSTGEIAQWWPESQGLNRKNPEMQKHDSRK